MRTRLLQVACVAAITVAPAALPAQIAMEEGGIARRSLDSQLILLREPVRCGPGRSPEKARDSVLAMQRVQARSLYAQLFVDLELSWMQIDALTLLIAEHTVLTTSWTAGCGVGFAPKQEDQQRALDVLTKIETSLGAAGFERFKEYQDTLFEQSQLRRLAQRLILVGHPLTSEQAHELVSIMKSEHASLIAPSGGSPEETVRRRDEFDRLIRPRFAAVLSAEQREYGEQYFEGRLQRRHKALDSYRAMLSSGGGAVFGVEAD